MQTRASLGANLTSNGDIVNITALKSLGRYTYDYSTEPVTTGAFNIIVVRVSRENCFLVDLKCTDKERTLIMPVFVLQWACRKEFNKDLVNKVESVVSVVSLVSSFSSVVMLTRGIGVSSFLWKAEQGFSYALLAKDAVNIMLTNKARNWIGQTKEGKDFLKAFDLIDVALDLGGESAIKALLRQDIIDAVGVLSASWQIIKLQVDVENFIDPKKVENFTTSFDNLLKEDNYVE